MTIAAWQALHAYTLYNEVVPTAANGYFYRATNIGSIPHKSGAAEPTWGTTPGGTQTDGNITWTCFQYTIRQRIMDAVKARFQGILISSGYLTNLGQNVKDWQESPLPAGAADSLILKDPVCSSASSAIGATQYHEHNLDVEASLETGSSASATPAEMRKMVGDIYKAIGVDSTWGGLAKRTLPQGDATTMDHSKNIISNTLFRFRIVFKTKAWDPFNQ